MASLQSAWKITPDEIRVAMREAVHACNERGLYFSGRWASEALTGLPPLGTGKRTRKRRDITTPWTDSLFLNSTLEATDEAEDEHDSYLLAKTLFDLKEYYRVAEILKGHTNCKSRFLRLYATYLAGEKREQQDRGEIFSHFDNTMKSNKELFRLEQELEEGYDADTLDSFCKYLYGVVLTKTQQTSRALTVLIESVHQYPYNWSAWLEIASCIPNEESAYSIVDQLPVSFMTSFFLLHATVEDPVRQDDFEASWTELSKLFPNSAYVQCEWARYLNNVQAADMSVEKFEQLLKDHPYRLDYMQDYSDALFVTKKYDQLSHLARYCAQVDPFRPETCFVIGNYYTAKGDHESSLVYFKRAVRFNRGFSKAWTLMGHEYMEIKNAYSAAEAFRRAIDLNVRDFRAWVGLGTAYEVARMPHVACQHYRRACAIRPLEASLWIRVADMLVMIGDESAAMICYQQILELDNQGAQIQALKVLPGLYSKAGDIETAARYYEMSIPMLSDQDSESNELANAIMFLARYERDRENIEKATRYANQALSVPTVRHQEEAKILLREMGVMTGSSELEHDMT
ncbi:anaphase-promoting complex subunit 8 [Entomortierella parvispora]|uniref:Anaphase-promoting complex subunit 8 n=1 Tax=Entomortierella parvispora TaxID=205924 RepID=A0A9P3HI97_9FUNG|nr:anaphase-promoting complex subunit 8 [Entomortierella parvispora]